MPIIGVPSITSPAVQFDELIRRVRHALGSDAKLTENEIEELARMRYEFVHDTWDWPERQRTAHLSTIALAQSTASTLATVTNNSNGVSFAGTPMLSTYNNAQIRIGEEEVYFFVKYMTASTIELYRDPDLQDAAPWNRDSGGGKSWTLFKSVVPVAEDMAHILSIVGKFQLEPFDGGTEALDLYDSYRLSTNSHSTHWVYYNSPRVTNGQQRVELWPAPTEARTYKCLYLKAAAAAILPTYVDIPVPPLQAFITADSCHLLHAKQGSSETMWENKALFFERLGNEMLTDYKVDRIEKRQPPTQLGRYFRHARFAGTDFAVDHHTDLIP